ncbi:MAG TPA: choice-of-anchor D domain-containing protein, partial [Kofleriaceae bacterium]
SFGTVGTGTTTSTMSCTVTNNGEAPSGALSIVLAGSDPGQFSLAAPSSGDCMPGTTQLAGGSTCTVRVAFDPTTTGAKSARVDVSGTPGGSGSCTLSGTGVDPAALSPATTSNAFDSVQLGQSGSAFTWTITNTGGVPTGTLTRSTSGDTADFTITDSGTEPCTGTLGAGATCSVLITFSPASFANKSLSITLSASPGGMARFTATGSALGTLVLSKAGGGTGTVVSTPAGISCLGGCSTQTAQFSGLSVVTLEAKGLPGSYFQGWAGACSGTRRFCTLSIDQATQTVTANFVPNTQNLVFATSETYAANFGGLAAADANCARLANAAGLPGTYVAWLSTSTVNAKDRLGSARGWVRLDGEPFADTVAALTTNHAVLHPIVYDENGTALAFGSDVAWTGTDVNGANPLACSDWTSTSASAQGWIGEAGAGPLGWTRINPNACSQGPYRLYCFQTDKTAPVTITPVAGKKIWVTSNDLPPDMTIAAANNACNTQRPAGVASGIALLATTMTAPSTLVGASTNYVRPDGVLVANGADLAATSNNLRPLRSGIWQHGDGTYDVTSSDAWTGANSFGSFSQTSTSGFDCNDWTAVSSLVRGGFGIFQRTSYSFWNQGSLQCDSLALLFRVYCVEP